VTAFAADPDATTNTVTYSLDDDAGGRFLINGTTGVVTVADGGLLDREAAASHDIVVRATSADGSSSTATFTIAVTDVNESPVGGVGDADGALDSVAENAAIGTVVGVTAFASDPDATTNTVTYSLDDNAGGRFSIEAATGIVRVAGGIDREAAASHDIVVRATSADGSSSTATFTIAVTDVNEAPVGAVSDTDGALDSVAENAAIGTVVGVTAFASDPDATTNTVTYSLDDSAGGRFSIEAATGIVRVAGAIDREAAASHDIVVRATSADGSFSTATFTIAVTDVNEAPVGAVSDTDATLDSVAENAANGTVVGVTAFASDPDATTNTVTYSLDDDAGGRFLIDGTTGVVTVADGSLLDREAAASHDVVVRATSVDGSSSTATFTIAVTDVNEAPVGAISDTDGALDSVAENAAVGTAVGVTAFATDPDATNNTVTYSLDDDAGGRFSIEAATGIVRVAGAIDREAAASHDIVVRATSADGSSSTATFAIAVTDVNESPVGAVADTDAALDSVAENAAVGTVVGVTAFASDPDATTNAVTYSLDDDAGGRFSIEAATGIARVAGAIDREAAASHDIIVRATSADGSFSTATFTIAVTDVNESPVSAVSDTDGTLDSVAENAAIGTAVGVTAFASDADATTNTVTYALDDDAGGRFSIEAATGIVRVAGAIDREAAASHDIIVRATSADGSFSIATFTIAVTDVNEAPVSAVSDTDATLNSVAENAANATVVGVTAFASDPDATTNTVTYSLDDDAGGRFLIDGTTGVVTVADGSLLDREAATSHDIVVRAASADGSFSTQTFTIAVTDVNESPVGAVSDVNGAPDSVAENAAIGTVVGVTASASDPDATNNTVTYSLDDDAGGRFSIEAATGIVRVAGAIDREAAASHDIVVRATSADSSSSTQTFTIAVTDVNEAPVGAVSDTNGALDSVAENAAIGTAVGVTAFASDPDATTNTVTYTLDDDAGGRFSIDAATGIVRVAGAIDREAAASHDIVVRATSADGSSSTATFTIAVTDVNESPVGGVADTDATLDSVAENAAVGTLVGVTAFASDPDATTNTVTYSLDDDAGGRFSIEAATGIVRVAGAIDREAAASHDIVVRASSADGSTSSQTFTVAVTDVNEAPVGAVSDADGAADNVAENAANGTMVGVTAFASDPDATTNTVTYSLDDDAGGRFLIDGTTGVVTVADGSLLDREAAASHDVVVRATSADGSFSTQTFTIALADVNEYNVGAVSDWDAGADTVPENSAAGTVVGVAAGAVDLDATNSSVTFTLDDSAGGRFAIDSLTGVMTVAGVLDAESAASHAVIVRATSADGSFSTQTFTIAVSNVDEAPSLMRNTLTVTQGTSVVLSGGDIAAVDPDTAPAGLVYSVSNLQGGQFELAGAPGAAVLSFTQAQINAGQVVFVHGGAAQAPAYDLGLTDGTSSIGPFSGSVSFSLAPVVVPPPAPGTQDQDAPGAELPPPLEIVAAPLKAEPVAAAPELEPFASWEFSPGRPDASFNDILAQNVELMSAQKRPLPKLVQPVLSLNEYDPEPPVDLVMQLLNIAPTQLEYRTSTPVDWEAAPAFEEGFQDEAQEQLQLLLDSVRFGGMALSVGVVWWASRISAMLGSLLASTPAWRHIDPLPVVSDGDDEKEKEKWLEPDARDVHADELAVSLVLEGGSSGGRGAAEDS
jgi:glucose-6-phosphate isomerase